MPVTWLCSGDTKRYSVSPKKDTTKISPSGCKVIILFISFGYEFSKPQIPHCSYHPLVTKCPGEHTQYTGTYLPRKLLQLTKNCRKSQLCIRYAQIFLDPQFSSVAQLCLTLWDPMDCSTPGFPVHDQLTEPTQTHVHWVSDAIQPSHPLSAPSSSCIQSFPESGSFQMSQFFASGNQSIGVLVSVSVLPMNI